MITVLLPNEVFVFGSNLLGNNIGGAALQAKNNFEAEDGIGEGLTGKCYAFPTLNPYYQKRHYVNLRYSRDKLYSTARSLPDKTFLLTPVGTGIAGYHKVEMELLFSDLPSNIKKVGWEDEDAKTSQKTE